MVPTKVIIFGGKGGGTLSAQIVHSLFRAHGSHELLGYLNDRLQKGSPLHGGIVTGRFDEWSQFSDDVRFVAPLHKAGSIQTNLRRISGLAIPEHRWIALIDPLANIAEKVFVGAGSVISAMGQVGPDASIGSHCFVRSGAIVSHDVTISDFVYLGQRSVICGYTFVGLGAHIAPGAIIRDSVSIGQFALVGMGAVVTNDIPPFAIVRGNPAQVTGYIEEI